MVVPKSDYDALAAELDQLKTALATDVLSAFMRNRELEAACRLALPVTRENLPKSHDAYQAIKAALATSEKEAGK